MSVVLRLEMIGEAERRQVGGKAFALSRMARHGLPVPPAVVVTADAYRRYMAETGLGERVLLELGRKRFEDLRWEEMWDAALRIRNMFLTTPLSGALRDELSRELARRFGNTPVVVRSSALDEDASGSSFAGLHESYVNVRGLESTLDHLRLVWASLWSDAALLYRQELGLDVAKSAMAVLFAHGARLFGQVYNDAMRPEDPFEFITLLSGSGLASVKRHDLMGELAQRLREDPRLAEGVDRADYDPPGDFRERLDELVGQMGAVLAPGEEGLARSAVLRLLREAAGTGKPVGLADPSRAQALEQEFLGRFAANQRTQAADLLDLARTSYRLRDDDNIYLGQVEAEVNRAAVEARRRLSERGLTLSAQVGAEQVAQALRDPAFQPLAPAETAHATRELVPQVRQLTGQPAGPGLATGTARVILKPPDLLDFRAGEVLVCDAIDPNMTFVVPLCAAIVERRGGMLIHGAIIAREYGLPCVTGVPQATEFIRTGDTLTVDGYLGIVVIRPGGNRT